MSESFVIPHSAIDVCALCVQVHRDENSGNILNLVMVKADEGTMLKVDLPVEFKGEDACPGLKKGIIFFFFSFFNISLLCSAYYYTSVYGKGTWKHVFSVMNTYIEVVFHRLQSQALDSTGTCSNSIRYFVIIDVL